MAPLVCNCLACLKSQYLRSSVRGIRSSGLPSALQWIGGLQRTLRQTKTKPNNNKMKSEMVFYRLQWKHWQGSRSRKALWEKSVFFFLFKISFNSGVVVHSFNPRRWGGSLWEVHIESSRPAWTIQWDPSTKSTEKLFLWVFACMYICVLHVCLVLKEARRGH